VREDFVELYLSDRSRLSRQ